MKIIEVDTKEFFEVMLLARVFDSCTKAAHILPPNEVIDIALQIVDKRLHDIRGRDPKLAEISTQVRSLLVTVRAFNDAYTRGEAAVARLRDDADEASGDGDEPKKDEAMIQGMIDIFRSLETDEPIN